MHFKQKIMNQASENGKKSNFRPDFDPVGTNLGPTYFSCGFKLCQMFDIVASYHRIQFQEKRIVQTQENRKNLNLGLD